jgi:16S rRNA (uracil1498-N3)-methyltransferase
VLRVPVDRLEPGELVLDARASHYVANVYRLAHGARIVLIEPERAVEAVAEVLDVERSGVRCRVGPVTPARAAARPVLLLQGLAKAEKLDAIVRDATELGATLVAAVETSRSVVRLGGRADKRLDRWRRIAREAARQAGRGDVPDVRGPMPWSEAVALAPTDALKVCLWEEATEPLGRELSRLSAEQAVAIAVGPEGGLTPEEAGLAAGAGYRLVSLGPFILRTETVAAAVLGAVIAQCQTVLR